jgi:cytidylate kinase
MDVALFVASAAATRYFSSSSPTGGMRNNSEKSPPTTPTIQLTVELLKQQNARTSTALIEQYQHSELFRKLAAYEGDLTVRRDNEDASKLQQGIEFAQKKGVIDPNYVPEPYVEIDVLGQTPDQVADHILQCVSQQQQKSSKATGSVIVLVGLSGTGKGTTVAKLGDQLVAQGRTVTTWSNGNIFRSLTLLAVTWWEQHQQKSGTTSSAQPFDAAAALTTENLKSFVQMLSFVKNPHTGEFDTRICGLGLDCYVSVVQNTLLKSPAVSRNIPTVAEQTQGEVIQFAAVAAETMGRDGICVLLEGREQTVNYVRTPHRFSLVLSDESLIGKRRAAQRIMAQGLLDLTNAATTSSSDANTQLVAVLDAALQNMVRGI